MCSTRGKSFTLAPENLIQKLQVGLRNLFGASILEQLDGMAYGLTLRNCYFRDHPEVAFSLTS